MANGGLVLYTQRERRGELQKPFEMAPGSTMGSAKPLESPGDAGGAGACAETIGMGSTGW